MRRPPIQFRLRTLLLVVVLAAAALEAYLLIRPSKPKYVAGPPNRGGLRVAILIHDGDWNIAPLAVPKLMEALSKPPLHFNVVISPAALSPRYPALILYPFIYLHGRTAFSFAKEDLDALRQHLEPGGGTLFGDAACGSPDFDAAFRRFVTKLLPNNPLVPIPRDDELYSARVGFDLGGSQYTKAAGGGRDFPQLEGVKINGHWAVIYSKYGVGCAWEPDHDQGCKGYVHDDAVKIGANIIIHSTLP